jgi:hypothetical protein
MSDLPVALPIQVHVGLEGDGLSGNVAEKLKVKLIVRVLR